MGCPSRLRGGQEAQGARLQQLDEHRWKRRQDEGLRGRGHVCWRCGVNMAGLLSNETKIVIHRTQRDTWKCRGRKQLTCVPCSWVLNSFCFFCVHLRARTNNTNPIAAAAKTTPGPAPARCITDLRPIYYDPARYDTWRRSIT
jgi:hypothetical protein